MKAAIFSRFFSVNLVAIRPRTFAAVNVRKSTFSAVFVYVFRYCFITTFASVSRAYLCHKYAQTAPELCSYYAIIAPEFVCDERAMNERQQTIFAGELCPNDWAKGRKSNSAKQFAIHLSLSNCVTTIKVNEL